MSTPGRRGPIEDQDWPERLEARVVTPGKSPRIHGYDVQNDLARHYRFSEVAALALGGELPTEDVGRALDVALTFAACVTVAEAPAHAAIVARVCGPRAASMVSVAAMALAEQAREILDRHDAILEQLAVGSLEAAASKLAPVDEEERAAVHRLRTALGSFASQVPALACDIGLEPALLATLLSCGIRTREKLEVALTLAKLTTVCAEALTWQPGDLRRYPMNLPRFVYEGSGHER